MIRAQRAQKRDQFAPNLKSLQSSRVARNMKLELGLRPYPTFFAAPLLAGRTDSCSAVASLSSSCWSHRFRNTPLMHGRLEPINASFMPLKLPQVSSRVQELALLH